MITNNDSLIKLPVLFKNLHNFLIQQKMQKYRHMQIFGILYKTDIENMLHSGIKDGSGRGEIEASS